MGNLLRDEEQNPWLQWREGLHDGKDPVLCDERNYKQKGDDERGRGTIVEEKKRITPQFMKVKTLNTDEDEDPQCYIMMCPWL